MKRHINLMAFVAYAVTLNSASQNYKANGNIVISKYSSAEDDDIQFLENEYDGIQNDYAYDPENDTYFLLYTTKNINEPQTIVLNDTNGLKSSNFDANHPIRFIIHGFRDGPNAIVNSKGRKAYADNGNYNVFVVDWSKGAATINYLLAKQRLYRVAEILAEFIDFILNTYNGKASVSQIYIIGHSLGAHLAGVAGKNVKAGKVNTIFGCDPAAPFFENEKPERRLSVGDAEYVEIIHTDRGGQGFHQPLGDADFYPNWGKSQPGCGIDWSGACSHQRSGIYWAESINSVLGFWAKPCSSYEDITNKNCTSNGDTVKMGGEPSNHGKAKGIYYLETASDSPFALGPIQ